MKLIRLSELPVGSCGMICDVAVSDYHKRRLYDLGIMPGVRVCCRYVAPAGSPTAFEVKGSLVALRLCDCIKIMVEYDG